MTDFGIRATRTLSTKLLLAVLLSLLGALGTYLVMFGIGSLFVDRYYMSTDFAAARKASIYTDFNRYVNEHHIRGTDAEALTQYLQTRGYVAITVYPTEELEYSLLSRPSAQSPGVQSLVAPQRVEPSGKLYPMRFDDGIYYISITDNSRAREDMLNRVTAMAVAVIVLVVVLFRYADHLTRRIVRLSQEASTVGAGDLNGAITVDGEDEIAALAEDIDGMRNAIIESMGNERRAWEANSELITAMSHDIRTPMTSLIGYLGLLNNSDALPEEDRHRYLEAAYGKSLALKELTDELFKYFLVFGHSELELQKEEFDAHMLLMQLLGEAEFDLQDYGMQVQSIDHLEDGCMITTDAAMLKRVIDNLVSNIKKYADRESPVVFLTEKRDSMIVVTVSNSISGAGAGTESTKIGLRTCEKIMEALGGSFSIVRDESHFAAEFGLPL